MTGLGMPFEFHLFRLLIVGCWCSIVPSTGCWAQTPEVPRVDARVDARKQATVGSVGSLKEVLLPGSLLRVKPLENRNAALVVRIVDSFQHGDSFRYDFTFMALEPGRYDLRDSLERVDGSAVGELPEVIVEVVSVLEAGHIPPHDLEQSWPSLGSYRFWVILLSVLWGIVLLAFIFWPKPGQVNHAHPSQAVTLADLLRPRLQAAADGQLESQQLAELERWLVEFWRRRLGLQALPPRQALSDLKQHALAGPLLQQLERWLHSPNREAKTSLQELLAPYAKMEVPGEDEVSFRRTIPDAAAGGRS